MPTWMSYLINVGFNWRANDFGKRRIGLISMPCDSPAAGLVALGAMCRRIATPGSNDLTEHFRRIETLARTRDRNTELRLRGRTGRYVADEIRNDGTVWIRRLDATDERHFVSRRNSVDWQFSGEAPVEVQQGNQLPFRKHYEAIIGESGSIEDSNLRHSDSSICLAGHVRGARWTRARMQALSIDVSDATADLGQLLAIQDWLPGSVSRVSFFNSRTDTIDRHSGRPQLLVADGDAAFLNAIDRAEFGHCDVIGVYSRVMERTRLDELGTKLGQLSQWYEVIDDAAENLSAIPRGIAVLRLRQR